uniref:MDM2 proto-oncogene n=1 Tax=Cynoglossus semilaevis TaxID=244447 RepID=A0A3P8UQ66_CYNSE
MFITGEHGLVIKNLGLLAHVLAIGKADNDKLRQTKKDLNFHSLLQDAGATKDLLTMKEVMFYLGQYIIQKKLYDQSQQHIVHCAQDELGRVLGVDSFSVKEPRVQEEENEGETEDEEEEDDRRKRRRSDSYSLTFDESLSWCVIGGLGRVRDLQSSQSSDTIKPQTRESKFLKETGKSDCDNFSVEFEVESIDSDDYNEDDASVSVYEVTIFEADDEDDSFDEDTEITEADYWRCVKCDELNPPLPRNCLRCWTLRRDWLPEESRGLDNTSPYWHKALPTKPSSQSEHEGMDVPDGKRAKTPSSQHLSDSNPSSAPCSQDLLCSSQPSSSSYSSSFDSQELVPELERSSSAEWRLPDSCLDPCLICQSRPKNGCIVHGRTGHLMSCYVCARKLKKRNKLCPVCRLPIQSVVLTYIS